jgi:hypothetical protein
MRLLPSFTISRIFNILKEKKTRQKQDKNKNKNKNIGLNFFILFTFFKAVKPQTLTTTGITKLNNYNIIDNHYFCYLFPLR